MGHGPHPATPPPACSRAGDRRAEPAEEIEKIAAKEAREVDSTHDPERKITQDLPSVQSLHAPLDAATSGTWV